MFYKLIFALTSHSRKENSRPHIQVSLSNYFSQYLHGLKHDFIFKLVNPVVYMINLIVFKAEMLLISSLTPKQDTNKEIPHERSRKSIHGVIVTAIFSTF